MKSFSLVIIAASLSFIAGAGLTYVAKTPWISDMANQPSIKPQEGPMLPPPGSVATDLIAGTGAPSGHMSGSDAGHESMGHQNAMGATGGHQHGGTAAKHDHAAKGSSQAMGHQHGTSAAGGHQHDGAAAKHDHATKGRPQAMGHQHGTSAAGGHQHDGAAAKHDHAAKGSSQAMGQQSTTAAGGHQHDGAATKDDQGSKGAAPAQTKAGKAQEPSVTTSHPLPYDLLGSAGTGPGTTGKGQSMGPPSSEQRKDAADIHEHSSKTEPPGKKEGGHDTHPSKSDGHESASQNPGSSASSGQKASKTVAHDHGNTGSSPAKAKHSHPSGTIDKMKTAPSAGTHQHGPGAGAAEGHAHGDMHSQAQVVNPIKPSEASVKKGQQLFNIYCSVCHGMEGRGGTPMASKIPGIPKFTPELLRKVDDNHMFSMVTSGHGPMPGYGEALTPEERWHVTNYVRTLPDKLAAEKKAPLRQGASR
jgi:mono/diheme cytochrome c family protein